MKLCNNLFSLCVLSIMSFLVEDIKREGGNEKKLLQVGFFLMLKPLRAWVPKRNF